MTRYRGMGICGSSCLCWRSPPSTSRVKTRQLPARGSEACQACHEDIYNAFAKNPHHAGRDGFQARLERAGLRVLPRPRSKAHRIGVGRGHSQSLEAGGAGGGQDLSVLPPESAHARGPLAEQPCPESGCVHDLSQDSRQRTAGTGGAQACGDQPAMRGLPSLDLEPVSEALQAPQLPEGAMSCVDCHNPHGSTRPAMTQASGPTNQDVSSANLGENFAYRVVGPFVADRVAGLRNGDQAPGAYVLCPAAWTVTLRARDAVTEQIRAPRVTPQSSHRRGTPRRARPRGRRRGSTASRDRPRRPRPCRATARRRARAGRHLRQRGGADDRRLAPWPAHLRAGRELVVRCSRSR